MDVAEVATLAALAESLVEARAQGREEDLAGAENDLSLQRWRSLEGEIAEVVAQHWGALDRAVDAWMAIKGPVWPM